jgi:hypothetical protein
MPPTDQRGENRSKAFLRHYHKAAQTTIPIDSKSRRDIEIQRRRNRTRLLKWCAIGFLLLSLVLAVILYLSESARRDQSQPEGFADIQHEISCGHTRPQI